MSPHSSPPHSKITHLFLPVVCSYSHRVRGVQSPPGQSGDGIPGFLHPNPTGSGAGALPGRVPVGQDSGDHRPDAGCEVSRGRWVGLHLEGFWSWGISCAFLAAHWAAHCKKWAPRIKSLFQLHLILGKFQEVISRVEGSRKIIYKNRSWSWFAAATVAIYCISYLQICSNHLLRNLWF